MKRFELPAILFAGCALLPPVHAQVAPPKPEPAEASADRTPQARFDALAAEAQKASRAQRSEYFEARREAEEAGKPEPERPKSAYLPFYPRFMAAAKAHAGTDDAVPFLCWTVTRGFRDDAPEAKAALDIVLAHHLASPKLDALAPSLPELAEMAGMPAEKAHGVCAEIADKNPSDKVRAWAHYTMNQKALLESPVDSDAFQTAFAKVSPLIEKADDGYLSQVFRGDVVVRKTFGLGMVAPDIVGPDLDNVDFKLSDYKGKVVFLDFWGDW